MRYAGALALVPDLQADVVGPEEIQIGVRLLADRLYRFSPDIEIRKEEPGILWINAVGLDALFGSPEGWTDEVAKDLTQAGFYARIVVGFSRFGSYAATKALHGSRVFSSFQEEKTAALSAPLQTFPLGFPLLERLSRLGIRTVGAFLRLPRGGVLRRFGQEAEEFYQFAAGELSLPVQSEPPRQELVLTQSLTHPETNQTRLLACFERLLDRIIEDVRTQGELITTLNLTLILEDGSCQTEEIKAAEPTKGPSLLSELMDLRLGSLSLEGGVEKICLSARRIAARDEQQELFRRRPKRDLDAGARAFARIRAEFGNQAIRSARIQDQHLPEQQFNWEPADKPLLGSPTSDGKDPILIRRILGKPVPLSPSFRMERVAPPGRTVGGPYIVSGGWWVRDERREYYFTEDAVAGVRGPRLRWLYYDRNENRWMLQGFVD
jgi:protein ImuB